MSKIQQKVLDVDGNPLEPGDRFIDLDHHDLPIIRSIYKYETLNSVRFYYQDNGKGTCTHNIQHFCQGNRFRKVGREVTGLYDRRGAPVNLEDSFYAKRDKDGKDVEGEVIDQNLGACRVFIRLSPEDEPIWLSFTIIRNELRRFGTKIERGSKLFRFV